MKNIIFISNLLLLFSACQLSEKKTNKSKIYVEEAFEILQQNIINEKGINLDSLKDNILSKIKSSTSQDSIHQLLRNGIRQINKHSDLFNPSEFANKLESPEILEPRGKMIYNEIAYVTIPPCEAIDSLNSKKYTDSLRNNLTRLYNLNPKGWIIDLRNNIVGNMYAMIAGLGLFFGEGNLGYEIGQRENEWYFKRKNEFGEMEFIELADSYYEFKNKLPIVGLINGQTASAAEAVTISLKCYPKSIIIGQRTYGISTGNEMFFLSDSTCLNITTSIMADCEKNKYPNGISPDVEIKEPLKLFKYAVSWIKENEN